MLHPSGGRWGRIIRPARPEDVPTIRNIVDASYRRYIQRIGRPHGPMLDDYGRRVTDNRAWVLQEAGRVVAILVLEHTAEGFRLDNIAVAPEAQGGGCRRMLIAFTETEAKRHGCREIHLNTHALMTENQALYQRLGFAETRRIAQQGFDRVYMTKPWHDPAVVALRRRTVLVEAPALPKEAAEVTVRLNDGSTLHTCVAQATGSVARPMSDEALARKFRVLAGWGWPDCDTRRFIELVWSLDELTDASAFPRAAAPR